MADAQDLKSWDYKKSCGFKSRHRHQLLRRVCSNGSFPGKFPSNFFAGSDILNRLSCTAWVSDLANQQRRGLVCDSQQLVT